MGYSLKALPAQASPRPCCFLLNYNIVNILHKPLNRLAGQFIKYCIVGGVGTILNVVIFWLLITDGHLHYVAAATISFCVAVTNNFLLNKYWTFNNPGGSGYGQGGRFLVVSLLSYFVNLLVLRLLINDFSFKQHEVIAQIIAISFVTLLNFMGNKLWSFRQPAS